MTSRFPDPIKPPQEVSRERTLRKKSLIRASLGGIALRTGVILIELLGYTAFNSSVLLADALASIMDVASTLFLIVCIRVASRPPDKNHPFGHGRFEPLGGLQLGLLLAILGGVVLFQQANSLLNHEPKEPLHQFAWVIPVIAVCLLELGYRLTIIASKKHHSPALAADAWHYRLDALNSAVAALALGIGAIVPAWSVDLDFVGAMTIALLMIGVGIKAAKGNLDQLIDRAPDEEFFDIVRSAALRVEGVSETEKVRIQQYGPDAHVDIDIEVDPKMTVDAAHRISQKVRAEIQKDWPAVRDVTVHIEPFYPNDH
ncbi:MAG: cation diffusion facilitator family transporter [Chlamydiales bacterium]|nr:cation diffusion facilitator family transporter [Chlamydiales bacterium]